MIRSIIGWQINEMYRSDAYRRYRPPKWDNHLNMSTSVFPFPRFGMYCSQDGPTQLCLSVYKPQKLVKYTSMYRKSTSHGTYAWQLCYRTGTAPCTTPRYCHHTPMMLIYIYIFMSGRPLCLLWGPKALELFAKTFSSNPEKLNQFS